MNHWKIDRPGAVTFADGRPTPHVGRTIALITPAELAALPDGTVLVDIFGHEEVKGVDEIDNDTRFGYLAVGHLLPEAEPEPQAFEATATRWQRILSRLLPHAPRPRPADDDKRTYLTTVVGIELDMLDRLRVLVTGKLKVETITLTDVEVKEAESISAISPGW